MSRRSEQLRAVAQDFCRVHDEWVNDDSRENPDETYWDAVNRLRESFASGDIPDDCRQLFEAVSAFGDEVESFDDREDGSRQMPSDSFWEGRLRVFQALTAQERQEQPLVPLEPMAELRAKGANDLQIATAWNLKDRYGNFMAQLVQREIDNPGCVTKPQSEFKGKGWIGVDGRDWVDRRLAKRQRAGNQPGEQNAAKAEKAKIATKPRKKAPESARELWEMGLGEGATPISVKQAALMLGKPESEVAQLFAKFEEERGRGMEDGSLEDAKTQAIKQKNAAGLGPGAIAKELGITIDEVAKVLGKRKAGRPPGRKPKVEEESEEQPAA